MTIASAVAQASLATAAEEEKVFKERLKELEEEKTDLQKTLGDLQHEREEDEKRWNEEMKKRIAFATEEQSRKFKEEKESLEKHLTERERQIDNLRSQLDDAVRKEKEREMENKEDEKKREEEEDREEVIEERKKREEVEMKMRCMIDEFQMKWKEKEEEVKKLKEDLNEGEKREIRLKEEAEAQREALSHEVHILMSQVGHPFSIELVQIQPEEIYNLRKERLELSLLLDPKCNYRGSSSSYTPLLFHRDIDGDIVREVEV